MLAALSHVREIGAVARSCGNSFQEKLGLLPADINHCLTTGPARDQPSPLTKQERLEDNHDSTTKKSQPLLVACLLLGFHETKLLIALERFKDG